MSITIEQVDNGYIVTNEGVFTDKRVYVDFIEVVNSIGHILSELKVGEKFDLVKVGDVDIAE